MPGSPRPQTLPLGDGESPFAVKRRLGRGRTGADPCPTEPIRIGPKRSTTNLSPRIRGFAKPEILARAAGQTGGTRRCLEMQISPVQGRLTGRMLGPPSLGARAFLEVAPFTDSLTSSFAMAAGAAAWRPDHRLRPSARNGPPSAAVPGPRRGSPTRIDLHIAPGAGDAGTSLRRDRFRRHLRTSPSSIGQAELRRLCRGGAWACSGPGRTDLFRSSWGRFGRRHGRRPAEHGSHPAVNSS